MYWYEDEVRRLESERSKLGYNPKVLFYGSSSMRMWSTLQKDFEPFSPVNLGFGGSTLAGCVWFYERVVAPYKPEAIVLYAGDNDLGDGRNPEEVFIFFKQFAADVHRTFGSIPCFFISLKPSIARWHLIEKFKYSNRIIESLIVHHFHNWQFVNVYNQMIDAKGFPKYEYYSNDGLHLNAKGYELWKNALYPKLAESIRII
ncbi:SGNH/GDSL hydrolase family protein [Mucilaginibacter gynuensis]|uniref:SGNH/GDSL hydrolase family protein n=1 Tax=Mucilaginibacter gynuensis TaxID=1302236 RepID=A0ABP8G2S6_9SPHI